MSKKTISQLKEYFKATKRPTESQFADLLDSYAHLDSEIIKYLAASEYTTYLEFPPNYQVGDYIEFLAFEQDMASSSGFYEISVAYTRGNIASAATHLAAVSHANPNIWRECGKINRNNYVGNEHTNCFTFDVNGALRKFRIRATKVDGAVEGTMFMVVKVRSINKNLSWTGLNTKGKDTSNIALQPMTDEWELLVGSAFSSESAKVAIKAKSSGNVGIGTLNPHQRLTVSGKQNLNEGVPTNGKNSTALFRIQSNDTAYGEVMDFGMNVGSSYGWIQPQDLNSTSVFYNLLLNPKGGNVGIGTQNPDQKLTVKGKIHAEDIIVDTNVPADYVFQKYYDGHSSIRVDYSMMNLNELESFIKEHKHLPEIPSGNQMTRDGVSLGDFQMKLLQKIEELTLYAIAQHKELEQLKSQIYNINA
jgi:hypothetical protein